MSEESVTRAAHNQRRHNVYFTPEPVFRDGKHLDVKAAIEASRKAKENGEIFDAPVHIPSEVAAI